MKLINKKRAVHHHIKKQIKVKVTNQQRYIGKGRIELKVVCSKT